MIKILKIINMKAIRKIFAVTFIIFFFIPLSQIFAQGGGPTGPPGGSGGGDTPIGGGAPIGGGSLILIGLAAAYGGKKVFDLRKNKEEEN